MVEKGIKLGFKKRNYDGMDDFHTHRDYEIYFFHEGRSKILIQNQIFDIQPGDIVLLNGLTKHRTISLPPNSNVRTTVEFYPIFIESTLKSLNSVHILSLFNKFNNSHIRVKEPKLLKKFEETLFDLNNLILLEKNNYEPNFLSGYIKLKFIEVLYQIYSFTTIDVTADIRTEKKTTDLQIEKILAFIMDNYMEKITLDILANEFSLNKNYISQLFKRILGMTVMDYILECRIEKAKYFLEVESNKKISDISQNVGFICSAHFSRNFHKCVGLTPTQYRKRVKFREESETKKTKY